MVEVRLFGGVSAVVDGDPIDVGPAKARALLAVLALSPGAAVPVSRLVEVLWGDDPPRTAEKTVQTYATAVRKALGPSSLTRVGSAYRLEVAPGAVDVVRFERLLSGGDIGAALEQWTAMPLAGLDAPGLGPVVDALVERRLVAVEADLERRVDDDPAAAVPALTELTATHPFREGLWALLMTALYRVGRQADALAAYRTARRHLVDELGVEPGPRLRELEAAILAQDAALAAERTGPGRGAGVGSAAGPAGVGHLPRRDVPLVAREAALDQVAEALDRCPLLTLVGPGGIGKTSLAVAAAQRFAPSVEGEAWLVELDQIATSAEVPRAVAAVVRVPEGPGQTVTQALITGLADRRALVVLDNCEHVIDGAAELARAVSAACPGVTVLATSRERLGIVGEQVVSVAPLPVAGAAELFAERARAIDPSFELEGCRSEVEQICERVDGLPLAVELAAARIATLAPADLLARLDDRLRLLGGTRPAGGDRHRSLRATIEWSHDLLAPDEQVVLRRLSVFAGRFDLAAAEAVVADPDGPLDEVAVDEALAGLVDRSMVVAESGPSGRRFRLLAAMRQLAAEHLGESGEAAGVADCHTDWVLASVRDIGRRLEGWDEIVAVDELSERWPDLRA
ncbi:MAG TPA: BTAD domain-containing putative transcriptional regulator, partial [Acidimicrobiales bacterium]|nr:BTAD domain-containing putative transcriptional regulator [Acidimicrobiales bacterium]